MVSILRPFRSVVLVWALLMLIGTAFVAVRLVPIHWRDAVGWGTLWPLLAAALATVFEVTVILATPIGYFVALCSGEISQRESAGSSVLGRRPVRVALELTVIWVLLASGIGGYANHRLTAPGRVARDLVEGAREMCLEGEGKNTVPVPLIGAHWICSPSNPPRLVGELARLGKATRYTARDIEVSEDLRYVDLTELDLSAPQSRSVPRLHLAVQGARVRGAWPWAKSQRLGPIVRAAFVAVMASSLGVWVVFLMDKRRLRARWMGFAVAVVAGALPWVALGAIDSRERWPTLAYAAVPCLAALTAFLLHRLLAGISASGYASATGTLPCSSERD